jgi:hypothetical protein
MQIHEFNCLTVNERADVVKKEGKHLFSHLGTHVSSLFYSVDDFSVEMWVDASNGNIMGVEPIRRMAA